MFEDFIICEGRRIYHYTAHIFLEILEVRLLLTCMSRFLEGEGGIPRVSPKLVWAHF